MIFGNEIRALGILSVLFSSNFHGCAPVQTFPLSKAAILQTSKEFDEVRWDLQKYQHHEFQLAGRIIRAETIPTGVVFLAEWLPFPKNPFVGPEAKSTSLSFRRISMHFSGTVDHDGQRKGNEFLMVGTMGARPKSVAYQNIPASIPYFTVQCLHIWKTAGDDLVEYIWMNPLDDRYPPPLEETYCVPPSLS